ncbi:MAG: type IX secretion system sortase PorU, partial [Tunicatimonas sp.]
MIVRGISFVTLAMSFGSLCLAKSSDQASGPSVLASGPWLKVAVTTDGLYRITADQLRQAGWNPAQINPNQLQLYGYGGGMLPQPLDSAYFPDLPENALWITGAEDDRLDEQDEIIFYGQSPSHLRYQPSGTDYALRHEKNLYADSSYYFLTVGETPGRRVAITPFEPNDGAPITEYDAYAAYENDAFNLRKSDAGSGREWYGESFSGGQTRAFPLGLAGATDGPVTVTVEVLGTSLTESSFAVNVNGAALGTLPVNAIADARYAAKGVRAQATFIQENNAIEGAALVANLTYQGGGTAYLNKMLVEARRPLRYEQPFTFRSLASARQEQTTFRLTSSPEDLIVWDVTDPQAPVRFDLIRQEGGHSFTVRTPGQLREFAAAGFSNLPTATVVESVAPQNLKDGNVPNLVIVSPPAFRAEAARLAELRRNHDGLSVRVVSPQEIYNEFSSGRQDVSAIRNYMKYLYDTEAAQIKYLLLFGKGSYDYRSDRAGNTNFVPTYESRNSVHPIFSYSSDDYYGFLEDDEGQWEESFTGDHTMEIGVGRLPVKSAAEARIVVDKLIHYATSARTQGRWRNRVVFVADDGDNNKHQRDAEQLSRRIDTAYASFSATKIYLDAFPQEALPGGEAAPAASQRIERELKQGALIMNYTGHGSETRWTQENIFNVNTINQLRNYDQLPFFVTATCEFGRHDDPDRVSGAEQLILSERGGAIGLVTTARPVYSNTNLLLNQAFYA